VFPAVAESPLKQKKGAAELRFYANFNERGSFLRSCCEPRGALAKKTRLERLH
jgi:hypothetical protein